MKSVYSAVRTGSLNKAVCASSLKGYILWYIMYSIVHLLVPVLLLKLYNRNGTACFQTSVTKDSAQRMQFPASSISKILAASLLFDLYTFLKHLDILDFKLSPCSICNTFSFGQFPDVLVLIADVSEHCQFHLHR